MTEALFFGCWNAPGHFLFGPGGTRCSLPNGRAYKLSCSLDSRFAPRKSKLYGLCWLAQAPDRDVDSATFWRYYDASEYPQGQFLRHTHDGFSLIQWWDRCQGDSRSGCNSTVLLPGERTTEELLDALHSVFPSVAENLRRAGVNLLEVKPAAQA